VVFLYLGWLLSGAAQTEPAGAEDRDGIDFYEKKVRPILAERCYKCHSVRAEKVKAGLLLDSREGMLKGGTSGPALVPGNHGRSLLWQALRYVDRNLQMPPDGKLPEAQFKDVEAWIRRGAPAPRGILPDLLAEARKFWSFQPPRASPLPPVRREGWCRNPIDAFILAKLEEQGLEPSSEADKATLLRRVTFDLLGLPPTPEELDAFLGDPHPDAYSRVVERLLASAHYGERWGRHWLDVARYADTPGTGGDTDRHYPYAYTYRDWVIRAFNEDLPYDQFLLRQIAADRLPGDSERQDLAALGFITVGRRHVDNVHEIRDDRIDVVTRGLLGLTVHCARCHDHKYDPIPTQDYYSLYGIFASSNEPGELPLQSAAEHSGPRIAFEKELGSLKAQLDGFMEKRQAEIVGDLRSSGKIALSLLTTWTMPGNIHHYNYERVRTLHALGLREYSWRMWNKFLDDLKKKHHPVLTPWVAFATLSEEEFKSQSHALSALFAWEEDAKKPINPWVRGLFQAEAPADLAELARRYGALLGSVASPEPDPDPTREELRQVLYGEGTPTNISVKNIGEMLSAEDRKKIERWKALIDHLIEHHPGAPPRAMALEDSDKPQDTPILKRGNPEDRGRTVPRRFLAILSAPDAPSFKDGSGRLELARAIATRENPLTARVMVNRIWAGHFGAGLVRTPSDFGTRGDPPTHPELLDWLALRFMDDHWSIKGLHRLILLSATYRQGSPDNPRAEQADPENRRFWRMTPRRLDFEELRDALLLVAGRLDPSLGGQPLQITSQPFPCRRTVYAFIDRVNLPELFRVFDFACPDLHTPQRLQTLVPQQALFLMNSPFVLDMARSLAARSDIAAETDPRRRVERLYRVVYGRPATTAQVVWAQDFVKEQKGRQGPAASEARSPWRYGTGRYDSGSQRVEKFEPLGFFTGSAWQESAGMADPNLGTARLTSEGGAPGLKAVVRRWVAPRDGILGIEGRLSHKERMGGGVAARIVSGHSGLLAFWSVSHVDCETRIEGLQVKAGETVDFLVECRGDSASGSFLWAPVLRLASESGSADSEEWRADRDFAGPLSPPLNAWEKLAQVLLWANEFVYLD
jgi:hypothetical protein